MKMFMCDDFLLESETAIHLYHSVAKHQPIIDYHCHLDPQAIAEDKNFSSITELWLSGDHYKWRGMRSAGVTEDYITGVQTNDYEKFMKWAEVVPKTLGNPLYHWTHLELKRYFGISALLNPNNAEAIWIECNNCLRTEEYSARNLLRKMNVKMVGTTDDPIDSLQYHKQLRDEGFEIKVLPTWRPDKVFKIENAGFLEYLNQLSKVSGVEINSYNDLLNALMVRLEHFDMNGCRSADHGLEVVRYADMPTTDAIGDTVCHNSYFTGILNKVRNGEVLSQIEIGQFHTALQVWMGRQYSRMGWVLQLHIGAQRNNNTRMFNKLGADAGFDSIGDSPIAYPLSRLLDAMDVTNQLPKTIIYCLNPRDNEVVGTMIGNFQGGGVAGKIQFGSGWWFNDQKDGMTRQIEQLSQLGLLSQFVGMLTDSRSFMSFPRHEYFRRILCNIIGGWAERGEIPYDLDLLSNMVKDICSNNAIKYFNIKVD